MAAFVDMSAGEVVIGGVKVAATAARLELKDSVTAWNGPGNYTISLDATGAWFVTYGQPPVESTGSTRAASGAPFINVAGAVLTPIGRVLTYDLRTLNVTAAAVNATVAHDVFSDGSYIQDAVVTERTLAPDVLALFGTIPSGPTEPTNPHDGEIFFNTTTDVLEIYFNGAWHPIFTVGSGATGLALQALFCAGDFTPSATGADAVTLELPYDAQTGASIAWTVEQIVFRVENAASTGTTSVKIQRSTGNGAFSNVGYLNNTSLDIAAGSYEATMSGGFTTSTVNSGDKLRAEYSAIGTGAAGFSCFVLLKG